MAHGLADQQLRSYEDIEKWLDSLIASNKKTAGILLSVPEGTEFP